MGVHVRGVGPTHLGVRRSGSGGGYPTSGTDSTWLGNEHLTLPSNVAPGGSVTMPVTVLAPATPGTYVLEYEMVEEGVAWFSQYLDSAVTVAGGSLAASYAISGQPSSFSPGGTASVQVTVTNNGTATWPAGGSTPVHLGVHFARRDGGNGVSGTDSTWATSQRFVLPADLAPGASVTLTATITAPITSGAYALEYEMVQENVAWFSQYQDSQVTVGSESAAPGSSTVNITRAPSGGLLNERTSKGTFYYLVDGLGSVAALTDASGNVVDRYSYDPYGAATTVAEQVANPFRYAGTLLDSSTGLYKMGARYYDPQVGRFTQVDPAACSKSNNLFWYANGDPANATDRAGLETAPPDDDSGTGGRGRFGLPSRAGLCDKCLNTLNYVMKFLCPVIRTPIVGGVVAGAICRPFGPLAPLCATALTIGCTGGHPASTNFVCTMVGLCQ